MTDSGVLEGTPEISEPEKEARRLAVLESYHVLDTLPETTLDDLTRLASAICQTPIALVSLVDRDRQWFKSKVNLDVPQTSRDVAFCAHAIQDPSHLFIVEDATKDSRFAVNPLVLGEPNIRFYAGCPLTTAAGDALGTLCVLDRRPRCLTKEQEEALRVLGQQVMIQFELRRTLRAGVEERARLEESERRQRELIRKLSIANSELEAFVTAASHDLKAPLLVVAGAAQWLEEDFEPFATAETRETMRLLRSRVSRMSNLLNDLLSYARIGKSGDDAVELIRGDVLIENILVLLDPRKFAVTVSPMFRSISVRRMPLQQVLMNLISNAIKHHDKDHGRIYLEVEEQGDVYQFTVRDDGPGIPAEHHDRVFQMFQTLKSKDQVEGSGLGLAMVRKYVELNGGAIYLESVPGQGSLFRFTWRKSNCEGPGH